MEPRDDAFAGVVGQERAVSQLRVAAVTPVHSYLLIGPAGAGANAAATGFSAALLCPLHGCGRCRDCRLALAGTHPDVSHFVPSGAFLRVSDAKEIVRIAARSPMEGARKVLVLHEFHRVEDVGPMLLKTIEEPPASSVFVILADVMVPELVTIASRSAIVDLPPLPPDVVTTALSEEGVSPDKARLAAGAAGGDIERARRLAADASLEARRRAWSLVPDRLDGTGATVAVVVSELLVLIGAAAEFPQDRSDQESAPSSADQSRRELRRHRREELRFGLSILAHRYHHELVQTKDQGRAAACLAGVAAIHATAEGLARNSNEALALQALFLQLPA